MKKSDRDLFDLLKQNLEISWICWVKYLRTQITLRNFDSSVCIHILTWPEISLKFISRSRLKWFQVFRAPGLLSKRQIFLCVAKIRILNFENAHVYALFYTPFKNLNQTVLGMLYKSFILTFETLILVIKRIYGM